MAGHVRRSRRRRPAEATNWDRVAGWYDGWVGSAGSEYHRRLAVPAVLDLLEPGPGEAILDVGAGQGVLAPSIIRSGAHYTGVDASTRLIGAARRRHGVDGRFIVGDATRLAAVRGLTAGSHDAAVFMLSIQDMAPLDDIVASVAWALAPASRIVVLMTHPGFRVPRHSGWGFDPTRRLTYRRVDNYLTEMAVPMKSLGRAQPTRSFHRPLSTYVNCLARHWFLVDAMVELPDLEPVERPGRGNRGTPGNRDIPLFLGLRARRPQSSRTAAP